MRILGSDTPDILRRCEYSGLALVSFLLEIIEAGDVLETVIKGAANGLELLGELGLVD